MQITGLRHCLRSSWIKTESNFHKGKVKWLYLYWITLSATWAVLPRGPVRVTSLESRVTTVGNRSTRRKPAMIGRGKLDNTLLTCDQGNFNQITAQSRNRTLVTVMRDTSTTTVPPGPYKYPASLSECRKLSPSAQPNQFWVTPRWFYGAGVITLVINNKH